MQLGVLEAVPRGAALPVLLDLGCGPGLLLHYLAATGRAGAVEYRGIDISPAMIDLGRSRWPGKDFQVRDITVDPLPPESVDVIVMNGVLTERQGIPRERMVTMAQTLLAAAFQAARFGIVFNVMSRHVDWEREDLFHWGFDEVAAFLKQNLTRHFSFRADYGLFEFTTFAWRHPRRLEASAGPDWWSA